MAKTKFTDYKIGDVVKDFRLTPPNMKVKILSQPTFFEKSDVEGELKCPGLGIGVDGRNIYPVSFDDEIIKRMSFPLDMAEEIIDFIEKEMED